MAIPASYIVEINPRLLKTGGTDLQINGLLLTKNNIIPLSSIVMEFTSAATVGAYFGTTSEEYENAVVYFRGYNNKTISPAAMMIARRVDEAVGAWLRSGRYDGTLAQLQKITDGGLTIYIDGTLIVVSGVDFSSATSYSGVAEILSTALDAQLSGVTVDYSSLTGAFQIYSPSGGETSTIDFAEAGTSGTDISAVLNLTQKHGAIISQGMEAMSIADNFAAIRAITDNWVSFWTTWEADSDEMLEYAKWATGMGVNYLYLPWSTSKTLLQQAGASSPADILADANVSAVSMQYGADGGALRSAFVAGMAASINWNRRNGTITFALKSQEGLAANVSNEADAATLEGKRVNFYGNFATRNDEFIFLYPGAMFGDYKFIDPYINAVWLNNAMQVSIMSGLTQAARAPYNEVGYAKIRAWLQDPVNRAKYNGVIDVGITLTESQKSELMSEAGRDISGELFTQGYVIQIDDPGAHIRTNRESPNISLWYTYGGSVHRIVVASTAIV